jgi:hypothetical protein
MYMTMVGKYIRMERPATEDEKAAGDPDTIGMECVVDAVEFTADGSVTIYGDDGYGIMVTPDQADQWEFTVWPDEATRLLDAAS